MSLFCGVYEIRNIINNRVYVGSSKKIKSRFRKHKNLLKRGTHDNDYLQKAWNKYGEENFTFSILETCEEELLVEIEQRYIDKFDSINDGYNLREAGSIGSHTEETKRKISKSQKGKPRPNKVTEETKRKISESTKGRKKSDETKAKMSEYQRNRPEEIRKKISESKMGHEVSEEVRKKVSAAQKGNKNRLGKKFSEESKKKMSESLKGRKRPEEVKKKISNSLVGNTRAKGKTRSEEAKRKTSEAMKKYWEERRKLKESSDKN